MHSEYNYILKIGKFFIGKYNKKKLQGKIFLGKLLEKGYKIILGKS